MEIDGVKGHIDAKIDGIVIDVKSASPFGFKKFKDYSLLENDPFGYLYQISGYGQCLTPGEEVAFLACDKVTGDLALMNVSPSVSQEYDAKERISYLKKVVSSPEMPERCYPDEPDGKSGNRKLGTNCSYCAFKKECWPGLRTFLYSTGPRYLTTVNELPRVYEVKDDY